MCGAFTFHNVSKLENLKAPVSKLLSQSWSQNSFETSYRHEISQRFGVLDRALITPSPCTLMGEVTLGLFLLDIEVFLL